MVKQRQHKEWYKLVTLYTARKPPQISKCSHQKNKEQGQRHLTRTHPGTWPFQMTTTIITPSQLTVMIMRYPLVDTHPRGPPPRRHLRHPKPWTTIHNTPGDYMPAQSPESHFSRNKIFSQPLNHPNQWRMTSQKGRRKYHGPPSNPTTTRETRTIKWTQTGSFWPHRRDIPSVHIAAYLLIQEGAVTYGSKIWHKTSTGRSILPGGPWSQKMKKPDTTSSLMNYPPRNTRYQAHQKYVLKVLTQTYLI